MAETENSKPTLRYTKLLTVTHLKMLAGQTKTFLSQWQFMKFVMYAVINILRLPILSFIHRILFNQR